MMRKSRDAHKQQRRAMHLKQLAESLRLRITQLQQQLSETLAELHGAEPSTEFTAVGDALSIKWTSVQQAALSPDDVWRFIEYRASPIFNTAKEPYMTDLSKTACEQALRISKEDAHNIKQALLASAAGAATVCSTQPKDAAKGLALAFVFLDEISRSGPAASETA